MDSPTHILLAATAGAALFKRRHGGAAVAIVAVGALVPDLDSLFLSNRLEYIRVHRGATHSLIGAAVLALGLAVVSWPVARRLSFGRRWFLAVFGMLVAIATDVTTWWGTQVYWPLSNDRARFGLVFIIDLWLTAIVLFPWLVAIVSKVRRRAFPARTFRVSLGLAIVWFAVCFTGRTMALSTLDTWATKKGGVAVDVFPQPFSPFRWALAVDGGDRYHIGYVDLLAGDEILEPQEFGMGDDEATAVVDATEEGRLLLWFYRLPIHEVATEGDRTTVTYRDLAYEARVTPLLRWIFARFGADPDGRAPFRYRFTLEDGVVVEHGWVED